jgi:hypothetical protein
VIRNEPLKWYEVVLVVAAYYAFARAFWTIIQRWLHNRTHKRKVYLVTMADIPYFLFEFFRLPVITVRWLRNRHRRETTMRSQTKTNQ